MRGAIALSVVVLMTAPAWLLPVILASTLAGFGVDVAVLFLALGGHRSVERARRLMQSPEGRGELRFQALRALLHDAPGDLYAVVFWYVAAGTGGVVVYRVVHALAGAWGADPERRKGFGHPAVVLDAAAVWVPDALASVTYRLLDGLLRWREGAPARPAVEVEATGRSLAAGLAVLGIGCGEDGRAAGAIDAADLGRGVTLVEQTLWLWTQLIVIVGGVVWVLNRG